jgi:putative transposase
MECLLWLVGGDGALGRHWPGLSPVPLPGLRQAVQRTQRRGAEPDLPAQRHHRLGGVLPPTLSADTAGSEQDPAARFHGQHQTIRTWEAKLLPIMGDALRKRHGTRRRSGRSWYVDETYLKVQGVRCYLYRAIDRDGNLIDTMLSESGNIVAAATALFRRAKATTGFTPDRVTTDGHGAYPRAIRSTLGRRVLHRTSAYLNNRLEQDHRGIKGRIRCMRGFKNYDAADRFCREHDELRDFLRARSRHNQHVPVPRRRNRFLRNARIALRILQIA